jgi:DNA-binding NarL/FixJ family response regulator
MRACSDEYSRSMNVLMIDDHVMFLQGMKNLLSVLVPELRVETAGEMGNAIKLVELAEFDLVLLDWHLADCSGEESIRRLRDAGCMARIVVLSGDTNATMIRNTVELGRIRSAGAGGAKVTPGGAHAH